METKPENKSVRLTIEQNNSTRLVCYMCHDRLGVPWCLVDEAGNWICPECAEKHDPVMAEVVRAATKRGRPRCERCDIDRGYPEAPKTEIEKIQDAAAALQADDLARLVEQLRALGELVRDYDNETCARAWKLREAAAEARARKMIAAGLTFDAVSIDEVRFVMDQGQLVKIDMDDMPF